MSAGLGHIHPHQPCWLQEIMFKGWLAGCAADSQCFESVSISLLKRGFQTCLFCGWVVFFSVTEYQDQKRLYRGNLLSCFWFTREKPPWLVWEAERVHLQPQQKQRKWTIRGVRKRCSKPSLSAVLLSARLLAPKVPWPLQTAAPAGDQFSNMSQWGTYLIQTTPTDHLQDMWDTARMNTLSHCQTREASRNAESRGSLCARQEAKEFWLSTPTDSDIVIFILHYLANEMVRTC